jgi:hypothetical protein
MEEHPERNAIASGVTIFNMKQMQMNRTQGNKVFYLF